jgi:hypothetical protein
MEGCWLYLLLVLLDRQVADDRLSIPGVLVLYPAAFTINALLVRLRWPKIWPWSVSWLLWVMAMLVIVKIQLAGNLAWSDTEWLLSVPQSIASVIYSFEPELLVLLITATMWWLGRRLARLNVTFSTLVSEFQFGLVMLVLISLIASLLNTSMINPFPVAFTFFLFALIGISVAHALEGNSWLSGLYQGHWSGLLLVSIGVILILGLLISLVATPDFLQGLWAAIKGVGEVIWGFIMKVIGFFAGLFSGSEPAELSPMPSMPAIEADEGFKLTMPEWLRSGLKIGWITMMVGLLLFALWRISSEIFRWLRRKLAGMAGAEFEPLPGAFKADIMGLLKRILSKIIGIRRLFRLRGRSTPAYAEIANVIQIYRQFLRWAAAGRYPRQASQTPYEYCYVLSDILPEASGDLDLVTQQYVKARYGARLSTTDELNELRQALHRVKKIRLKKVRIRSTHEKEVN